METYSEVVKLQGDTSDWNESLANATKRYQEFLDSLVYKSKDTPVLDLDKAFRNIQKGFVDTVKAQADAYAKMAQQNEDVIKRSIEANDAAETEKLRQTEIANKIRAEENQGVIERWIASENAGVEAVGAEHEGAIKRWAENDARVTEEAAKEQAAIKLAAEKAFIEKSDAYEKAALKDIASAQKAEEKEFEQLEKDATRSAKESDEARVALAKAASEAIMRANKLELDNFIKNTREKAAVAKESETNRGLSRGLRVGAGFAASTGSFRAAGAMYGAANMAQMAGVGDIAIPTAALIGFGVAATGAAAAVALMAGPGGELNQELAKMSTLLESATTSQEDFDKSLDKTTESAIRISDKFNITLIDVVKSYKQALSSGIDSSELDAFFQHAGTLANALNTDLGDAQNILTSFKNAYNLTVGELGHVNDVLFNTINIGKVEVDDLTKNLGRVLPTAKGAGIAIEDLSAAVALLTVKGVTTSQTITSLNSFINAMITPGEKAKALFEKLGIATGDMAFRTGTLKDKIAEIKAATGGSESLIGQLFPEDRAKRAVQFLVDSTEQLGDFTKAEYEAGTADVARARSMNNLFDNIGSAWKTFWNGTVGAAAKADGWLNTVLFGFGTSTADSKFQAVVKDIEQKLNKELENFKASGAAGSGFDIRSILLEQAAKAFQAAGDSGAKSYVHGGGLVDTLMAGKGKYVTTNAETEQKTKLEEGEKYLAHYQDYIDDTSKKTSILIDQLAQLPKDPKISKLDQKDFNERATPAQKEAIEDLRLKNEAIAEQIEKEKEVLKIQIEQAIFAKEQLTIGVAKKNLDAAIKRGDPGDIEKYTNAFNNAVAMFEAEKQEIYKTADSTDIDRLSVEYVSNAKKIADDISQARTQGRQRDLEEAQKEAAKEVKDFNTIVQQLYDADTKNFEKAEAEKSKIHTKALTEMEKETKRYNDLNQEISKNVLNSKLGAADPDRRRYIATEARDEAKAKLDDVIAKGGTSDEFKNAVKDFQEAAAAVRDAMNARDPQRAARNYQEDESVVGAANSTYNSKFAWRNQQEEEMAKRKANYNKKSPKEILAEAKGESKTNKDVAQIIADVRLKLQIDGTLSPETLQAITTKLTDQIDQKLKNRSGNPGRYDPSSRGNNAPSSRSPASDGSSNNDSGYQSDENTPTPYDPSQYDNQY